MSDQAGATGATDPMPQPATDPAPTAPGAAGGDAGGTAGAGWESKIGVHVADGPDGTSQVHALSPDGTEHTITMPTNHGALAAFKAEVSGWITRLGERATSWEKR